MGPVRAAATRWKLPLYSDEIGTTSTEHTLTTIYQDFAHSVAVWIESMWTETGLRIAQERKPLFDAYIEEYKKEAEFMHGAFRKLIQ